MKPPGVRHGAVSVADASLFVLRSATEQDAERLVLARKFRAKKLVIDDRICANDLLAHDLFAVVRNERLEIVDVDPLRARASPGDRQSFRDNAHAMPACDERLEIGRASCRERAW